MSQETVGHHKILELKSFSRKHDAQNIKSFLWDLNYYFGAVHTLQLEKLMLMACIILVTQNSSGMCKSRIILNPCQNVE